MIIEASVTAVGAWGLRRLAHHAILRGLRAPRLPHTTGPAGHGFANDVVREVRIAGPRGKQLFGWMVQAPLACDHPAPAVLVMHGWGANASMMGSVVPPLHAADFAVLLLDARCHGRSDDEVFTSLPRFAEDIAIGLAWLRTQPDLAADRLALLRHSVGAAAVGQRRPRPAHSHGCACQNAGGLLARGLRRAGGGRWKRQTLHLACWPDARALRQRLPSCPCMPLHAGFGSSPISRSLR